MILLCIGDLHWSQPVIIVADFGKQPDWAHERLR
jgi:hypothetical protein